MFDKTFHPPAGLTATPADPGPRRPRSRPRAGLVALTAAGAITLAATNAAAAVTRISSCIGNSEPSHQQILANLAGGTSARAAGNDDLIDAQRMSDDDAATEAAQIFESDFDSACAVAGFARNSQTLVALDAEGRFLPLLRTQRNALDAAGPVDLRGSGLFNTIVALQGDGSSSASDGVRNRTTGPTAPADAALLSWESTASSSSDPDYADLTVQGNTGGGIDGAANVFIPVPPAAWSGLIVMGGVGIAAGIKRLRHRG